MRRGPPYRSRDRAALSLLGIERTERHSRSGRDQGVSRGPVTVRSRTGEASTMFERRWLPGPRAKSSMGHVSLGSDHSLALIAAACASAEGARQLTIAGASWTSSSFLRASTMNKAKSTRRVMLLSRTGSPTCRPPRWQAPGSRPHRGRSRARQSTWYHWQTPVGMLPPGRRRRQSEQAAASQPAVFRNALNLRE